MESAARVAVWRGVFGASQSGSELTIPVLLDTLRINPLFGSGPIKKWDIFV